MDNPRIEGASKGSTIVLFALPLLGHLQQILQLSSALSSRGVRVLCYSSLAFAERLTNASAIWRPYPCSLLDGVGYAPDLYLRLMRCAQLLFRNEVARLREDRASAIVYDAMLPWGSAVAESLEVPAVSLVANFVCHEPVGEMIRNCRVAPMHIVDLMAGCHARAEAGEVITQIRSEFGFALRDVGGMPFPSERLNLVFTSALLQHYSEVLDERYVFVGPALPREAPQEDVVAQDLRDTPLVYISFGTVFNRDRELFDICFQALSRLKCEVIASTGGSHKASDFPRAGNARILPFVAQSAVLRRAAVVINNAGMNTVCESLSHGVPVVVIPSTEEQDIFARRLHELGCAVHIPRAEVSVDTLASRVGHLFEDINARHACERVAESFRTAGGAELAAERIM